MGDFSAVGEVGEVGKAGAVYEMAAQTANWRVMVYAGACNDLQPGFQAFLDRNSGKRFSPNASVLLQVTLSQPARTFEVVPPAPSVPPASPAPPAPLAQTMRYVTAPNASVLSLIREWNPYPLPANNPRHLYEFIKWGLSLTKYRHAKPVLILSGHSAGLLGVLEDRSQGYPMLMTIPAMSRALRAAQAATQRRIALLVLDMCYMNGMEILYELAGPEKPAAQYLILPYDDAPLAGMPLEGLIAALPSAVGTGQAKPPGQSGQGGPTTPPAQSEPAAVQAIVNYVNSQWHRDNAACYGIRLDSARMEAMATTLNAIAARHLEITCLKTYFPRQLPYLEIMQCIRDCLAPQLITTAGWPSPAPSLRISLAEDLCKKRIPGEIYGALRFGRLPEWKRLIGISSGVGSHSHSRNYATKLFPEMVPVPKEILIENLLERFPGWDCSQAKRKLSELGWDRVPNISYSLESRLGAAPDKNIYFLR